MKYTVIKDVKTSKDKTTFYVFPGERDGETAKFAEMLVKITEGSVRDFEDFESLKSFTAEKKDDTVLVFAGGNKFAGVPDPSALDEQFVSDAFSGKAESAEAKVPETPAAQVPDAARLAEEYGKFHEGCVEIASLVNDILGCRSKTGVTLVANGILNLVRYLDKMAVDTLDALPKEAK